MLRNAIPVEPITPARVQEAADILGLAFQNDPICTYMIPDPKHRAAVLHWMHSRWARVLMEYGGAFITGGGEGVALWIPPRARPGLTAYIRHGLLLVPFQLGWRNLARSARVHLDVLRRQREEISEPHWVLDVLGVAPAFQRRGFGGALLAHVFRLADAGGYPCYVITHNVKNIAFYEAHGFRLIRMAHTLPDGPPTCSLRRPAQ